MRKVLKTGFLGIVALIVLGIIVANMGSDETSTSPENSNTETTQASLTEEDTEKQQKEKQEQKEEKKMAGIGEELQVGDVVFKVNEVSTTKRIDDGPFYYEPNAEGSVFFLVNVSVTNKGNEMINTDSSYFKLKKGDVTYSPTTLITSDDQFFLFEGINPGLTKTGFVVFEVPEGEKEFVLNVQTGFWGTEQGQIQLY